MLRVGPFNDAATARRVATLLSSLLRQREEKGEVITIEDGDKVYLQVSGGATMNDVVVAVTLAQGITPDFQREDYY